MSTMNMHAAPQRTAAETALIDAFGERLAHLPGDGAVMVKRDNAIEQIKTEIRRQYSPWADRKSAADYCQCSVAEIDKAANTGTIKRFFREKTPMFKKSGHPKSLDAWIEQGQIPMSRRNLNFAKRKGNQ